MVRLSTDNLSIGYGERLIVKSLSIEIPDRKITTIIGPNGCGKSTLLKAITRIISHQSGSILLDGKDISKVNTKLLAKQIAILPQTPESASGLTVGELVSYGRSYEPTAHHQTSHANRRDFRNQGQTHRRKH